MKKAVAYSDGSSTPQPKKAKNKKPPHGGWGFCVVDEHDSKNLVHQEYGFHPKTSNNRMELTGVINAIKFCFNNYHNLQELTLYTDCKIISDALWLGWLDAWEYRGWKRADGEDVKNKDLWVVLMKLRKKFRFRKIELNVIWVRGHNGNIYNELVDGLAKKGKFSKYKNKRYG